MESESKRPHSRQLTLVILLRVVSLCAGVYQLILGEFVIGVYILLAMGALLLPKLFTRNHIRSVPLELEMIFSVMVLLALVLGETFNFYQLIPYYDKFIHFSLPLFTGFMGFLLAYTMHVSGGLHMRTVPLIVIIVLVTMGIGATWEIIEYLSDTLIAPHTNIFGHLQGSPTESRIDDTMFDLMFDMLGGIFGALLGLRYIESGRKNKNSRVPALIKEIVSGFQIRSKQ